MHSIKRNAHNFRNKHAVCAHVLKETLTVKGFMMQIMKRVKLRINERKSEHDHFPRSQKWCSLAIASSRDESQFPSRARAAHLIKADSCYRTYA